MKMNNVNDKIKEKICVLHIEEKLVFSKKSLNKNRFLRIKI